LLACMKASNSSSVEEGKQVQQVPIVFDALHVDTSTCHYSTWHYTILLDILKYAVTYQT
jgi:hypothetical protein